jgi:hypothetical protein
MPDKRSAFSGMTGDMGRGLGGYVVPTIARCPQGIFEYNNAPR